MDTAAIARLTGVTVAAVQKWRRDGLLPPPDDLIGLTGYRWYPATIEAWWAEHRRDAGIKDA